MNYRESVIDRVLRLNNKLWRDKNREKKLNVTKTSEREKVGLKSGQDNKDKKPKVII